MIIDAIVACSAVVLVIVVALFFNAYLMPGPLRYTVPRGLHLELLLLIGQLQDVKAGAEVFTAASGTGYYLRVSPSSAYVARVSDHRRVYAYAVPTDPTSPIHYTERYVSRQHAASEGETVMAFLEEVAQHEAFSRPATIGVVEDIVARLQHDLTPYIVNLR